MKYTVSSTLLLTLTLLMTTSCATTTGPLRDTPGYATIEDCDTTAIDLAAGLAFTGCLVVVAADAGRSQLPLPAVGDVFVLGPAISTRANRQGCEAADCRLPLASSSTWHASDREQFWTPHVRAADGVIGADNDRFLHLVFSDGVVAARMCVARRGDRFVGDTAPHSSVGGLAHERGSIVFERTACDPAVVDAATARWQSEARRR